MQNQHSVNEKLRHYAIKTRLPVLRKTEHCEVAKLEANAKPTLCKQEIEAFAMPLAKYLQLL